MGYQLLSGLGDTFDIMSQFKAAAATGQTGINNSAAYQVASTYKGESIYDYLVLTKRDPSVANRRSLYSKYGFSDPYNNFGTQNLALLAAIKKDDLTGAPAQIKPATDEFINPEEGWNSEPTKKEPSTVPEFTGTPYEKLNALISYWENQIKTSEYQDLSDVFKVAVQNIILERAQFCVKSYFEQTTPEWQTLEKGVLNLITKLQALGNEKTLAELRASYDRTNNFFTNLKIELTKGVANLSGLADFGLTLLAFGIIAAITAIGGYLSGSWLLSVFKGDSILTAELKTLKEVIEKSEAEKEKLKNDVLVIEQKAADIEVEKNAFKVELQIKKNRIGIEY